VRSDNGGPGLPKGSRNKLAEAFINEAYASWQKHGPAAFDRRRNTAR